MPNQISYQVYFQTNRIREQVLQGVVWAEILGPPPRQKAVPQMNPIIQAMPSCKHERAFFLPQ